MAQTISYQDLPELMIKILAHEENIALNIQIEKKNGLTTQQGDAMMGVIRKVIFQSITPAMVVETIKHDVGLDDKKARALALDLLGLRFLPMEWFIGNVESLISELGGNVADYLQQARKNYPEVYTPDAAQEEVVGSSEAAADLAEDEKQLLKDFDDRLTTFRGRAEILLRLTGWSGRVEDAMKDGRLSQTEGEELLRVLDSLSYAINTQDLNALEVQSIRRRLTKALDQIERLG